MPQTLLLVDAPNHAFRAFHAIQSDMRNPDGFPTRALFGFSRMLQSLIREYKPAFVAIVFDNGQSFRNALFPDYKGQRPDMPEDLRLQWPELLALSEAFGFQVLSIPNTEADDVIGTLAVRYASDDVHVKIVSGDKDFCQLVNDKIHILDLMKNLELGPKEVAERWGVPPERIIDLLSLMGDSSDNVPGVPGVGEKKAAQFIQKFGALDAVLASGPAIGGKTGQAVTDHANAARLARTLVTIDLNQDVGALTLDDLRPKRPDGPRLKELLTRFNFRTMLQEMTAAGAFSDVPAAPVVVGERQPRPVVTLPAVWGPQPLAALDARLRAAGAFTLQLVQDASLPLQPPLRQLDLAWEELGHVYHTSVPADARHLAALAPLLGDASVQKLGHDLKPQLSALRAAGLPVRGLGGDTCIADYLLHPEGKHGLEELCSREWDAYSLKAGSVGLIHQLHTSLAAQLEAASLTSLYRSLELPLVDVLVEMEQNGILLDVPALKGLSEELDGRIKKMIKDLHALAGEEFNVNSTQQLGVILFEKFKLPPPKKTKTGYSTDAETLAQVEHPLARAILAYRELAKLKSTYIDTLPGFVSPRDHRVHTTFSQVVAATGRLSSIDPNLQNIPIRSEEGRRIRHCFHAAPGCVFLSADYSQIELRVLAHFCKEPALVEAFQLDQDIHRRTASEIFGVAPALVTAEMRRNAKAINFGIVYGMSAFRLANDLNIPRKDAQTFMDGYFARYPRVRDYMSDAVNEARERGYALTLAGRRRPIPGLNASNHNDRLAAERVAINTPIQGTAADLIKQAMIAVLAWLPQTRARLLLQVHDELLLEVPKEDAEAVGAEVKRILEGVARLDVPLKAELGYATTWDAAH